METKRVVVKCFVLVGATEYQAWEVPVSWDNDELQDFAWECAVQYAESYGVYNPGDAPDEFDDEDEEEAYGEAYHAWEQVEGFAIPYDADKHDGKLIYGYNSEVQWNKV